MSDPTQGTPGGSEDNDAGTTPPQIGMWSEQPGQDTPLGRLEHAGESWRVRVVVEAVSGGLAQGIISFRLGDERHDTAPVIIESSPSMVLQRAGQLPPPMLEQMLVQLLRSAGR